MSAKKKNPATETDLPVSMKKRIAIITAICLVVGTIVTVLTFLRPAKPNATPISQVSYGSNSPNLYQSGTGNIAILGPATFVTSSPVSLNQLLSADDRVANAAANRIYKKLKEAEPLEIGLQVLETTGEIGKLGLRLNQIFEFDKANKVNYRTITMQSPPPPSGLAVTCTDSPSLQLKAFLDQLFAEFKQPPKINYEPNRATNSLFIQLSP